MLLALDTSTPATTVALHDGEAVIAEHTAVDAMRHGEVLAPAIERLLGEAGVDRERLTGIAVGVGPGPFTGLRVGVVTANTLGYALGVPVSGVCSLDILAAGVEPEELETAGVREAGSFLVVTDARRKEVFWARYADPYTRVDGPHVDRPDAVGTQADGTVTPASGRGAELYTEVFTDRLPGPGDPRAGVLAELVASGRAAVTEPFPLYLRRPDASLPGARKRVTRN